MTKGQERSVIRLIDAKLSNFFTNHWDKCEIRDAIAKDVIADINATANWSGLKEDEVILGDIDTALTRELKRRILGKQSFFNIVFIWFIIKENLG